MSKKRRYQPLVAVPVEEALAQLRVGPEQVFLLGDCHMVRDDIDDGAETGVACGLEERAQLSLATELLRDPGRIRYVVSVGRAALRLKHRREVEVRDAEPMQVRQHDFAHAPETQLR